MQCFDAPAQIRLLLALGRWRLQARYYDCMLMVDLLHLNRRGMSIPQGSTGLQEWPGQMQIAEGPSAEPRPIWRLCIEGWTLLGSILSGCCIAGSRLRIQKGV